jgi:hypothetical protein
VSTDPLDPHYAARVGRLDAAEWHAIVRHFDDLSLYQTLPYAQCRWPRSGVSHLVLARDGENVAAAQVRLVPVPLLGGIAYVRWGPLWRLHGRSPDLAVLRQVVRALRLEYVVRRRHLVRLLPRELETSAEVRQVFLDEGFRPQPAGEATLLVDVAPPLETLRAGLDGSWRKNLKRAQRGALVFTEGTEPELFDRFAPIHAEMVERKRLVEFGEVDVHRRIQELLPPEWRLRVMLCSEDGTADVAGAITSALGDTALAVLWATNPRGRDLRGAFALQWRVLDWLKRQGCRSYDLGGVDKEANPGGHRFKSGLSGTSGREVRFVGAFELSARPLLPFLLRTMLSSRTASRRLRRALEQALAPRGAKPAEDPGLSARSPRAPEQREEGSRDDLPPGGGGAHGAPGDAGRAGPSRADRSGPPRPT